ncbi:hypothetical protein MTR67_011936 [Solanum verrucosum]|uniref:Uncharacterized protein n=1 Tax=Solanum verrucosum TaxID=315347 RepID=A0AAF0QDK8_SOLVR|nr:hypothetical protein MTR67_011936 [Solanum verrucosum]
MHKKASTEVIYGL